LQSAKAALAASGYRASREAQHVRIIGSLEFTVGLELADVQQLNSRFCYLLQQYKL